MKFALLTLTLLGASTSFAQVQVYIAPPPVIRFEVAPRLVEVSPGVRVVPDLDQEVFFDNGYYWTRREGGWWRTRDYRGGWGVVDRRYVPQYIYRVPEGRYRHWRHEEKEERREFKHEEHAREKEHRREERGERREEHRDEHRDERREERRDERVVAPPPPGQHGGDHGHHH